MSEPQQSPRQLHLPAACLTKLFVLFTPLELAQAACVSKHWHDVSSNDAVWKPLCESVFLLSSAKAPGGAACPTYSAAFRAWKTHPVASRYEEFVPRVAAAFKSMRAWLEEHMPAIAESLLPGATEEELDQAEKELGSVPFPPALRVLYRICKGQDLAFDNLFSRGRVPQRGVHESRFHGLFGGYSFYQHAVSTRMYPLSRMVRMTLYAREKRVLKPQGAILFGASFNFHKLFQVQLSNGSIHVSTGSLEASFIPAAPASPAGTNDGLLRWIEKYAENLAAGYYEVGPVINDNLNSTGIILYPAQGPAVDVAVTRGVKVEASSVLVPEQSSIGANGTHSFVLSYCIRFSLLDQEAQLAALQAAAGSTAGGGQEPLEPMESCQLKRRHWVICDGPHREEVRGDAVVGHYPLLSAGGPRFCYQSCTEQSETVGWMQGSFGFVSGSISVPNGPLFDVKCPRFYLRVPDYIF